MKKYLIAILLAMVGSVADAAWHTYPEQGCAVYVRFLAKDSYYFCGAQEPRCNGDWAEKSELQSGWAVKWYNEGQYEKLHDKRFWCCTGTVTSDTSNLNKKEKPSGTPGRWVEGSDFWVNTETKTINVSGGKCSYTVKTDICGNVDDSDKERCSSKNVTSEQLSCPEGQYFRTSSKSCATLCESGYAYESNTSNKCIECPETKTQGIVSDTGSITTETVAPEHRICRKCDAATSFFDPKTKKCVLKSALTSLSVVDLEGRSASTKSKNIKDECWTKFGEDYKSCMKQIGKVF